MAEKRKVRPGPQRRETTHAQALVSPQQPPISRTNPATARPAEPNPARTRSAPGKREAAAIKDAGNRCNERHLRFQVDCAVEGGIIKADPRHNDEYGHFLRTLDAFGTTSGDF